MTRIIQKQADGYAIVADNWQLIRDAEDGTLPAVSHLAPGGVIVPLAYWLEHQEALQATRGVEELGVWIKPDQDPLALEDMLDQLSLVAVDFPVFTDGRGFSSAVLLRNRLKFAGQVRAIGDVLRDQLLYMARCGFDAFAVRADKNIEDALKAFSEFSVTYQGAIDQPLPLFRRRSPYPTKDAA